MFELKRYHQRLCRAQGTETPGQDCRSPDDHMYPIGRLIDNFDPKGQANNNTADKQHDKYRRTIPGILFAQLKTAARTFFDNSKKTGIKPAFAAFWAAAQDAGENRRDG